MSTYKHMMKHTTNSLKQKHVLRISSKNEYIFKKYNNK